MQIDSPSTKNGGVQLESAPPAPPNAASPVAPTDSGLGELARSPQLMAMQGMAMVKDGFQLLSNGIPELAQLLTQSMTQLEQMVAQSMAQTMGGPQMAAGPPGMVPAMGPPPGMGGPPMTGGPPEAPPPGRPNM